ncbi:MAG: aminotransferase class V-fold PLP-dependent enzyme [Nitrospinae bacterium]|nr:aminotransferase class V-fold PLP-dependent enzyme [Nitrospinota bacterium]
MTPSPRAARPYDGAESTLIRRSFPMLAEYTFLNAASMTPMPEPTAEAIARFGEGAARSAYLNMPQWMATVAETRRQSAALIGCAPEEVAFIRNTAEGGSKVAGGFRWRAGDEVIVNDLEFPSNVYPWLNLERTRGVKVVTVQSVGGRVPVASIEAALTPKTRMVAISSVQFTTGFRADLPALAELLRGKGVRLFVDAIQSLGLVPMEAKEWGIDYLACGGHKWLCATEGIGLLYCAKERMEELDLVTAGWHTVADELNFTKIDFTLKPDAQRFEEGTPNLVGIHALNASLSLVMERGVERNFAHVLSLTDRLIDGLRAKGYDIVSPIENDGERSGIVIFAPRDRAALAPLARRLEEANVMVIPRGIGIRVSPHFYNTTEDVEKMLGMM